MSHQKKSSSDSCITDKKSNEDNNAKLYYSHLKQLVKLWGIARKSKTKSDIVAFDGCLSDISNIYASNTSLTLHQVIASIKDRISATDNRQVELKLAIENIDQLVNELIKASKDTNDPMLMEYTETTPLDLIEVLAKPIEQKPRFHASTNVVAVIDDDRATRGALGKILEQFNFKAVLFDSIDAFKENKPSVELILLDVVMPGVSKEQVFDFAEEQYRLGTLVVSCSGLFNLETRLAAVRANVADFIVKPVNSTSLIEKINRVIQRKKHIQYKIVFVDDQESMGTFYQTVFKQYGIHVEYIRAANELFDSLDSLKPDLFLLDMFMPDIDGLEIATMLRQEEKFDFAPIIFLTSDDTSETKLSVLEHGADDVISKQTPAHLVARQVIARLSRSSMISNFVSKDALTGVLNHGQIIEAASNILRLSKRNETKNVLALIDLDNFKSVNDTYGHGAGDNVLSTFGQQLRRSLRDTDQIGRYGGEEFIIILQGVEMPDAITKLNDMRENFEQLSFSHGKQKFSVTFSAGIVLLNDFGQIRSAINTADSRLYEAKASGKNKIVSKDSTRH
ncbi:MAG: diguanylate cyclase [Pseudomonadota bacterium]